jgi:hypothetical protein
MSAERPYNSPIGLTPDQAKGVAEEIINKWDGQRGLRLDGGYLEELIRKYGPKATLNDVLRDLNKSQK